MTKKDITDKMLRLYEPWSGTLQEIIDKRVEYEDTSIKEYKDYREIIRVADKSKELEAADKDLSSALYATALWMTYKISSDEPVFVEETEDSQRLNYNAIADHLIRRYCIISNNEEAFLYINDRYYGPPNSASRLKKDITKILKSTAYSDSRKVEQIIRDIIYRIKAETMKFAFPFNTKSKDLIPVKNGVVVRKSLNVLLPKSPVWGFTYSLPVIYDPSIPTGEVEKFLASIVNPEDAVLLRQIPAQALMQSPHYQQAYLLTGDGANGKSTYISLIRDLVGRDSTTSVSLQDIVGDRFKAAELQGKLMNLYPDLPKTSLKTTGTFKALTGGDAVTVEKKYVHPFSLINKAVFVFSANELPEVEDSTFAFWRRWEVIPFPFKFPTDHKFVERLITPRNLSAFLNIVIKEMDNIERNGVTRSATVEKAMERWKSRSNSAYAFIRDVLVKDPKGELPKEPLYHTDYLKYCEDNDYTALSPKRFTEEMYKFGAEVIQVTTKDRQRPRVYRGVRFREEGDEKKEEMKDKTEGTTVFDEFQSIQAVPKGEEEDEETNEETQE
jgi:putative DNA primase/helicase